LDVWRATPNCPLSDKQLADLFNNIEDIYRFNRRVTFVLCKVTELVESEHKLAL
jgi:hypothetical protein